MFVQLHVHVHVDMYMYNTPQDSLHKSVIGNECDIDP